LAYAHALKQNIIQFTTKSGSKSSLIVKECFIAKFSGFWQHSTQKTALTVKNAFFLKKVSSERIKENDILFQMWL